MMRLDVVNNIILGQLWLTVNGNKMRNNVQRLTSLSSYFVNVIIALKRKSARRNEMIH